MTKLLTFSNCFTQTTKTLLLFAAVCSLLSCGGGGGGDSSGSKNGKSAATGIRIINAALDFPALQINLVGAVAPEGLNISSAAFGETAYHGAVGAGLVNIAISSRSNPVAALWSGTTEVLKNQHKSVLVYGGYTDHDPRFAVINDSGIEIQKGQSAFRIINGVVDSNLITASVVGLGSTAATSIGGASAYVAIPAGTYEFAVNSGASIISRTSGVLQSGSAYSVVSQGAAGYFVTSTLLLD